MSLKVWLPLVRDVNNQGCSNIEVSNTGTTFISGGKLGHSVNIAAGNRLDFDPSIFSNFKEVSISLWLYINAWNASYETYFQFGLGTAPWTSYILGLLRNNTTSKIAFVISDNSSSTQSNCISENLSTATWYHVVCTYCSGHISLYINGELVNDYATAIVPKFSAITKCVIGRIDSASYYSNCRMNDFRIYDHALSLKEIKDLSRGLVAHYPLNDPYSTNNLIRNGFGELEMENWTGTLAGNSQNTDLPTADTNIKRAYYSNEMRDYIPINRMNTYTLSMYIKQKATSGTSYPSILTYDADKKFISHQMTPDGFRTATYTTLSSALNTGDTVIHATDLSQWVTTSGNYLNSCAVFGYVDGLGYKYPDLQYTQDVPSFASGTVEKTNIDKTNNTITLLSAYTGKPRPAGTSICQSTEGSTYYYPYGGINVANVTDWTFKTVNLTPNGINRLRWTRYIRWYNYNSNPLYYAGLKLIDTTNSEVVYDVSGNKYHMTRAGNVTISESSPRYSRSMNFSSGNYCMANYNSNTYLPTEDLTVSIWINFTTWGNPISCTEGGGWNIEVASSSINFDVYISGVGYLVVKSNVNSTTLQDGKWHMLAGTYNMSTKTGSIYIDGVLKGTAVTTGTKLSYAANRLIISGEAQTTTPASSVYTGKMSDARIYATCLSVEDILDLYQNSAHLDNKGNLTAYEFIEG